MLVGNTLVGALNVNATNRRRHRRFTLGQVKALNILASTAAAALENASLHTQVREAEEKYRSIFENAVEGIFQTTPEGRFLAANPAMARMLSYESPAELIASITNLAQQLHVEPARRAEVQQLLAEHGVVQGFEARFYRRDGSVIWGSLSVRVVRDASGTLLYYEGTIKDVSERNRAEEALQQEAQISAALAEQAQSANRLKSDFLATISHELRTPLNIVMGYTDLLLDGDFGSLTTEQSEFLQSVKKAAYQELELIAAMLDVSRLEAGRLPVELGEMHLPELMDELATEVQDLLRKKPGLGLEWEVAPGLPVLRADRTKLKVVLKNLLSNAVKFTDTGKVRVEACACDGGIEISVTDTGIGIAPEVQPVLFDMFWQGDSSMTRRHEGVGLGLYIVRRLLELLGGTVTVESEVGRGSTFRVWVPNA